MNGVKISKNNLLVQFFCLFLVFCYSCPVNAQKTFSIGGNQNTYITISSRSSQVEKFAAKELQTYLLKILGSNLPIYEYNQVATGEMDKVILVIGSDKNDPFPSKINIGKHLSGNKGYLIKTINHANKQYIIMGGNERQSVLFAVYDFLEKIGVRFLGFKSRNGEVIPHKKTLVIPIINCVEIPRFKHRIITRNNFDEKTNHQKYIDVIDWAAKNRFNVYLDQPTSPEKQPFNELLKRGFQLWLGAHIWASFNPDVALYETHPEYFPLKDSKRTTSYYSPWKGCIAFCRSNQEAMKIFVSNAVTYVKKYPQIDVLALWQMDGPQEWWQCECEKCKRYTFSEWNLILANNVAKALEKEDLGHVRLQCLAYNESLQPPQKVKPYKGGAKYDILYCNGGRDFSVSMLDKKNQKLPTHIARDSREKQRYINAAYFLTGKNNKDFGAKQRLEVWLKHLKKNKYKGSISILAYFNSHVGAWANIHWMNYIYGDGGGNGCPYNPMVLSTDFRLYLKLGISGWGNCNDWYNDNPNPLWNRLMARLLWNPYEKEENIKRDFYKYYYGPASDVMANYYNSFWNEIALTTIDTEGAKRIQKLTYLLNKADNTAATNNYPYLQDRLKIARNFHNRAIKIKKWAYKCFNQDGSPKAKYLDMDFKKRFKLFNEFINQ